eukprot:2159738-Rhodomonas_salina.1
MLDARAKVAWNAHRLARENTMMVRDGLRWRCFVFDVGASCACGTSGRIFGFLTYCFFSQRVTLSRVQYLRSALMLPVRHYLRRYLPLALP